MSNTNNGQKMMLHTKMMSGYPILQSGGQLMGQPSSHQQDSMQCSEIMTNQTNGFLQGSANQLSTNSDNIQSLERPPEKRVKQNESHSNNIQSQQPNVLDQQNYPNRKLENNLAQLKELEKQNSQNLLKEFDAMQFKYSNEEYSYQINRYCKRIASEKHAQEIACKFPLYKMIRSIIKKFLFNELEMIFFGYVLEESKWSVHDLEVRKHAYFMNDFLNITEVKDLLEYKSVLLYLILTAYGVKFYLNDEQDMRMFNQHMNLIVKDFNFLFSYWSKNYGSATFKIIPKSLNRVYRNLSKKPTDQNKKQHEDYNALVDAIIQISPPYNNEKSNENESTASKLTKHNQHNSIGNMNANVGPLVQKDNIQSNKNSTYQSSSNQMLQRIVDSKQKSMLKQNQAQSSNLSVMQQGVLPGMENYQAQFSTSNYAPSASQQPQQSQQIIDSKFRLEQNIPQQQLAQQGRDLNEFPGDFMSNGKGVGLNVVGLATDAVGIESSNMVKRDLSRLNGFSSNGNFNDNIDFFQNMGTLNNSNGNYNFNSMNLGQQYYNSFLQNLNNPPQLDSVSKQNTSFQIGKSPSSVIQMQHLPSTNIQQQQQQQESTQHFGLNSSGQFDNNPSQLQSISNQPGGSLGQSGAFNTSNLAFSNGFLGQNNSYNSNQVGYNQLYSQIHGSNNQSNQQSLSGIVFPSQQQQTKKN